MKKVLLLLVLLALGFTAYWYLRGQKSETPLQQPGLAVSTSTQAPDFSSNIRRDAVFVLNFSPRKFDPAVSYVTSRWDELNKTKVFRMLDVNKNFWQEFRKGFEKGKNQGALDQASQDLVFEEVMNWCQEFWSSLEGLTLVIGPEFFETLVEYMDNPETQAIPTVLLEARFKDENFPKRVVKLLDEKLLEGKTEIEKPGGRITRNSAGSKTNYTQSWNVKKESGAKNIPGNLIFNGSSIVEVFGAQTEESFRPKSAEDSLAFAMDGKLGQAILPNSASAFYINFAPLKAVIEKIKSVDQSKENDQAWEIWNKFVTNDLDVLTASLNFEGGVRARNCSSLKTESKLKGFYRELSKGEAGGNSKNLLKYLLEDRTFFAFSIDTTGALAYFSYLQDLYSSVGAPSLDIFVSVLETLKNTLTKLKPSEISFLLNTNIGVPIPDGALLMKTELAGEASPLKVIKDTLEAIKTEIYAKTGASPQGPNFEVASAKDGKEFLKISVEGSPFFLVGQPLNNTAFGFAMTEFALSELEKLLKSDKSYFGNFEEHVPGVLASLDSGDFYAYINTAPLIEMGRSFIPFMLMNQPPGGNIKPEDVEEVLSLFSGSFVSAQRTVAMDANIFCTDSYSLTLPRKPAAASR